MSDTKNISNVLTEIDKNDALIDDHDQLDSLYGDDLEDRDTPSDDEIDDDDEDSFDKRWYPD